MWTVLWTSRTHRHPYDARVRRPAVWLVAAAASLLAVGLAAARVGEAPGGLSNWQALALGLVQGSTELLPISSSGHLALAPWLFEWDYLTENRAFGHTFDVILHLGTLAAVVGYFWREVVTLPVAWFRSVGKRRVDTPEEKLAWLVVLATIPGVAVGAVAGAFIATEAGQPWQIALSFAVFGVVLWAADRRPATREMASITSRNAVAIGVSQALALLPGVSRSGITITTARFLGLDRDAAARFSFLLAIPITLGAILYKLVGDVALGELPEGVWGPLAVGLIASTVSGLAAIEGLLSYVRRHDYTPFVVYRLLFALVVFVLIVGGVRPATFS